MNQPSIESLQQFIEICDSFEQLILRGERPEISAALAKVEDHQRERLFEELLKVELFHRRARGEAPRVEEYTPHFPQHHNVLHRVFAPEGPIDSVNDTNSVQASLEQTVIGGQSAPVELAEGKHQSSVEFPDCGRYCIEQQLGAGAFGIVYLARDVALPRKVAVKMLREKFSGVGEVQHRFREEARRLATLDHPHIVPVYDFGQAASGQWFLVSKYLPGGSLEDKLKVQTVPVDRAAEIIADLADALHHAHQLGLVHRDVKPANVLLDERGTPLLTDFGLALHEDQQAQHRGEISGSPAYMAPEQIEGRSHHLDGRADIWALGVMLYEMMCSRRPFSGTNANELFEEIRQREPKPPRMIDDSLPEELQEIVQRCLAKPVADRYGSASDLARDLRKWLATPAVPATSGRGRVYFACIGAILILLLLTKGIWLPSESESPSVRSVPTAGSQPSRDENLFAKANSASSAIVTEQTGQLDVLVWNKQDDRRNGLSVRNNFDALPFRNDDRWQVRIELAEPMYVYLVWVDSAGQVTPIYPWQNFDWQQTPDMLRPVRELTLPRDLDPDDGKREAFILDGAGVECLVLLARELPLSENYDWQASFKQLQGVELPGTNWFYQFDRDRVMAGVDRAPVGKDKVDDSLDKFRIALRNQFSESDFPVVQGLAIRK